MFGIECGAKKGVTPVDASTADASTPNTPLTTKQRGQLGEDAAAVFLQQNGYQIIERNWRPGNRLRGEIDLIAWSLDARGQRVLCFLEVKARSRSFSDSPAENRPALREAAAPQEAVTVSKQRQIARLANAYVSIHRLDNLACRFDVVEVHLARRAVSHCTLCVNAFDYRE